MHRIFLDSSLLDPLRADVLRAIYSPDKLDAYKFVETEQDATVVIGAKAGESKAPARNKTIMVILVGRDKQVHTIKPVAEEIWALLNISGSAL